MGVGGGIGYLFADKMSSGRIAFLENQLQLAYGQRDEYFREAALLRDEVAKSKDNRHDDPITAAEILKQSEDNSRSLAKLNSILRDENSKLLEEIANLRGRLAVVSGSEGDRNQKLIRQLRQKTLTAARACWFAAKDEINRTNALLEGGSAFDRLDAVRAAYSLVVHGGAVGAAPLEVYTKVIAELAPSDEPAATNAIRELDATKSAAAQLAQVKYVSDYSAWRAGSDVGTLEKAMAAIDILIRQLEEAQ